MTNFLRMHGQVALALTIFLGVSAAHAGAILVRTRAPLTRSGAALLGARHGASAAEPLLLPGVLRLETPDVVGTLRNLAGDGSVLYASPERSVSLVETIPSDPNFSFQWHHRNIGQMSGIPGADIRSTFAWDVTTGSAANVVAIVDSGVDLTHPDLSSRVWNNPGEIDGNGVDDDGNGFVDDVRGWSFADGNSDVADVLGHGTAVASMAGSARNSAGVVGVDWNSPLMTVKIFGATGTTSESTAINGVIYAINNGARIINTSWGDHAYSPFYADMAVYAKQQGSVIFAAAGNYNVNTEQSPFYPANLGHSSVASVSATDNADLPWYNYGRNITLSAPGYSVYMARRSGTYGYGSGTSYASPVAAAAASLVKARFPSVDMFSLKYRLAGTCNAVTLMSERNSVSGRLNAYQAVTVQDSIPPGPINDLSIHQLAYHGVVLRLTAPGGDGSTGRASFYQVRASQGVLSASQFEVVPDLSVPEIPAPAGAPQFLRLAPLDSGATYQVAVRAIDAAGNAGQISNVLTVAVPNPPTLFTDSCDTTHPAWTATGFYLAPGGAHTGVLSWQDSPGGQQFAADTSASLTSTAFDVRALEQPRLSFYLERLIVPTADRVTSLCVQVSVDGGTEWEDIRQFHGPCSPSRRFIVPLDEYGGSANLRLRFLFAAGASARADDGVYLDDIQLCSGNEPFPAEEEQVIEAVNYFGLRNNLADLDLEGAWSYYLGGNSTAPRAEAMATFTAAAGTASTRAIYAPFITTPGLYDIYCTWGQQSTSTSVPYIVQHAAGEQTVLVDHQSSGYRYRWLKLGRFPLAYGRQGRVSIDAEHAAAGTVTADGIAFRYAGLSSPTVAEAVHWELYD